jgi:hypothetical protein
MKPNVLILMASLGLATAAPAGTLTLHMTGYFGPATTLDGVPLGANTPYDLHALFDSTAAIGPESSSLFPITSLSITVGDTPYTALPVPSLKVHLLTFVGAYAVGLHDPVVNAGFYGMFDGAEPAFSVSAPTPSVLTDPIWSLVWPGLAISLADGAGDLVVNDVTWYPETDFPFTAELTAVPEPGQWAMMGVTLLGASGLMLRQRRSKVVK